ncbi:MAG: hypothetical protein M5U28_16340 [Sandaracinaceae bacterium]|nr:hypothetical protein [Sandaracinaceae bacterium]
MTVRWAVLAAAGALWVSSPTGAEAQAVTVQGQVEVQPYGQPPPATASRLGYGYGQPQYGQPQYGQPQYGQPQYAPTYAPTYQPQVRQVRYVEQQTSIKGLWIPGVILLGLSYVLTGTLASNFSLDAEYVGYSWIPLVGPWLMLGAADGDDQFAGALVGGIAQAAGLTMFVLGLVLRQSVRVAVYSLDRHDERSPELALDVRPAPAGGMVGLTLSHF